jgi:hypothetical protein
LPVCSSDGRDNKVLVNIDAATDGVDNLEHNHFLSGCSIVAIQAETARPGINRELFIQR